ncbi:hypothetical protein RVY75_05050 [Bacillus mycoides]|uniref:hypothetical protein n=1 Tax=Bacillus TaxID=1386 RepID=UPI001912B827|nr:MULTISPECIES: hypothetical protein [Bacillus]MBK5426080.1 hypothetical protein [Bacillus sp. TH30]WOA64452.1 hypothetical protein RVY75_05050 [Bacillus mycoides]
MNKKLLTSLLCSTFLFGLSACSSHDTSSIHTKNEQETSKETKNDELSNKDSQKELPTHGDSSDVYISIRSADSLDVPKNTQGLTLKINGDMLDEGIELKVE